MGKGKKGQGGRGMEGRGEGGRGRKKGRAKAEVKGTMGQG